MNRGREGDIAMKDFRNQLAAFAALRDVVNHYDALFGLAHTGREKADLVEFLKSL